MLLMSARLTHSAVLSIVVALGLIFPAHRLGTRPSMISGISTPYAGHFELVATLRTATDAVSRVTDLARARVMVRAAKPPPNAKRITGPKLFTAATPAKKRP